MTRWEYKIVEEVDLQGGRLTEWGTKGWELVTILVNQRGVAWNQWIFKRPIEEHQESPRSYGTIPGKRP